MEGVRLSDESAVEIDESDGRHGLDKTRILDHLCIAMQPLQRQIGDEAILEVVLVELLEGVRVIVPCHGIGRRKVIVLLLLL